MPSDVFTAHVESPVTVGTEYASPWLPTQYRLSKTFAGSVYHSERGGTFRLANEAEVWPPSFGFGSTGPFSDSAGAQTVSYSFVRGYPERYAAALALSIWTC